jgi:hypothetical protein
MSISLDSASVHLRPYGLEFTGVKIESCDGIALLQVRNIRSGTTHFRAPHELYALAPEFEAAVECAFTMVGLSQTN